jgi:pimeloyl-ACP methyl ester carboxylesterase
MKYLMEWVLEFLLVLLHFPLSILSPILSWKPTQGSPDKPDILLIERWLKRNPLHYVMKRYFERRNYTVYSISFPMLKDSFSLSGKQLAEFIEKKDLKNVILVGLSNGGLTCYEYVMNYGGWERTRKLITIGTPFKGAILGFLLWKTRVGKEIHTAGEYTAALQKIKPLHPERIHCIAARYDEMVGHARSFLRDAHQVTIDVAGHNLLHTIWIPTFRRVERIINS